MKPKVFLTRELPPEVMARLRELFDVEANPEDRALSRAEIMEGLKDKDALLCLLTDVIDGEIMDAAPGLKVIANYAVGFNNIDIDAASERGIPVTNTPGVLTDTTADTAFALIMAAGRRVGEGERLLRSGGWEGWAPLQLLGRDVHGASLGLIGLGRIGKAVAKRARGFDMRVLYWNRTRLPEDEEKELGVVFASFEKVLSESDFVSLNVAYTDDTHHLIGAEAFGIMRGSAYLINTARGPVVDEKALVRALRNGRIAGAGLDVYENEPRIEPELLELENVVLLPHLGSATIATRTKMGMIAVENILAALEGEKIPNLVNAKG